MTVCVGIFQSITHLYNIYSIVKNRIISKLEFLISTLICQNIIYSNPLNNQIRELEAPSLLETGQFYVQGYTIVSLFVLSYHIHKHIIVQMMFLCEL